MKYYILAKAAEYVIFRVQENDDESFKEKYGTEILVEAESMMQLLIRFEQDILLSVDYMRADGKIIHPKRTQAL